MPEYYQLVFIQLHETFSMAIHKRYVLNPSEFRRTLLLNIRCDFIESSEVQQYSMLMKTLDDLECELKRIIERHSVFYWIHLYRRIAPTLVDDLGGNTNECTTITVRNHVEQAIYKYSNLSNNDDYALSSKVDFNEILGGMLAQSMGKLFPKEFVDIYEKGLQTNPQWVLTKFSKNDLLDVYYLEGLAYQYWYISAKMRALGKGIFLEITELGEIYEARTSEQESLIVSFDKRNEENSPASGFTSNLGTFTPSIKGEFHDTVLCALLNPLRYKLKDFGIKGELKNVSPNYLPWFVNSFEYYSSHKYLEDFFEKKYKFGFLEFCQMSTVFSHLLATNNPRKRFNGLDEDNNIGMSFYLSFQRAYNLHGRLLVDIKNEILEYVKSLRERNHIKPSRLENQLDDMLDFITLDSSKQQFLSLWSNGPKPILVKINDYYLCDYSSWYPLLKNVFFGLRNYDPESKKGVEFEYAFAKTAKSAGFDVVMQSTKIRCSNLSREVDVAIKIQDSLYLFECRASERPLDFMIGNPKTIKNRCSDLKGKLKQSDTLQVFIENNRVGDNYDFSWAKEIYSAVVSPYTEWIWSTEESLWTSCNKFPRIMSVHEAIEYLKHECNMV